MAMTVRNKSLRSREAVEIKTQGPPSSRAPCFLHSVSWGEWARGRGQRREDKGTFPGVLICIYICENKSIKRTSCKIRERNNGAG